MTVKSPKLNEYKELTEDFEDFTIKGFFFISSDGYKNLLNTESATLPSKNVPSLLALYEDCNRIKSEDIIVVNNKLYTVTGLSNIQEQNLIGILSLEEVYGRHERS